MTKKLYFDKRQVKAGILFLIALLLIPSVIKYGITPLAFCFLFIIFGIHTLREKKNINGLLDDIPITPKIIFRGYVVILIAVWPISLVFGLFFEKEYIDSFGTFFAFVAVSILSNFVWGVLFFVIILLPAVSTINYFVTRKKNI